MVVENATMHLGRPIYQKEVTSLVVNSGQAVTAFSIERGELTENCGVDICGYEALRKLLPHINCAGSSPPSIKKCANCQK